MKLISIQTTENKGKTETERLEPESIEKLSSDVSEQHRRVSLKTQKKLLSDLAESLGRERSQKKPQTVRPLFRDKNTTNTQNFITKKKTTHHSSTLDVIIAD